MKDTDTGLSVSLQYNVFGFPFIGVEMGACSAYCDEDGRPTVEIRLNGIVIRSLFDDPDKRYDIKGENGHIFGPYSHCVWFTDVSYRRRLSQEDILREVRDEQSE